MGRFSVTVGGRQWRKWCGLADEPRFTRRFIRRERRARRDARPTQGGE